MSTTRKMWKDYKYMENNILLNNEWVNQEISEEIQNHMEISANKNTNLQNLRDAAKVVRGKFIAIQA